MSLEGNKVMMLLGPRYEDEEAEGPLEFLRENGAEVDIVGIRTGELKGLHGKVKIEVDTEVSEVKPEEYDALVIPGGKSPAALRKHPETLDLVKLFYETGRPIAAICHGPQMLASAGLLKGKRITGYPGIKEEMEDVGAEFVDEPVVIDGSLITSRKPKDIPDFNKAIEEALNET